ncbi:uncharacterized protein ACNLHF_014123 [Anomaloglossus baeobatrachus]|uniref:uncharacterized protein LOC142297347 n=1 Tax=Anomaloglossus baeobatrachus TaxID=238106 RepID=UPI003F4F6632
MSAETFAYDDSTSLSILAQVTNSTEFLKTPIREVRTRDWEKEKRTFISLDLHCTTLAEYHRQNRIPRGLRSHLKPTLFANIDDYCKKYQQILNKCSLDLIVLTIEYLQTAIKESKDKIQSIEAQLADSLTPSDLTNLKNKTEDALKEFRRNLEDKKRQKFQRDTDDYLQNRVYRWNDWSLNNTRPWHRQPSYNPSASSGSESSGSRTNSVSFLGRGKKRGNPRGGRGGGDWGMTLRSQKT